MKHERPMLIGPDGAEQLEWALLQSPVTELADMLKPGSLDTIEPFPESSIALAAVFHNRQYYPSLPGSPIGQHGSGRHRKPKS